MTRRRLQAAPQALALAAAIVGFGVFSSSVGIGALPTSTLPIYGDTNGDGSRTTVAELGDVNGDDIHDYAVGMPYADAAGTDSGIVYVFLGRAGALSPTPTAAELGAASFTITGHGGELLGFAVAGGDFNGDGLATSPSARRWQARPRKSRAGAVYVVFGSRTPRNVSTTSSTPTGYTNDPANPAPHSPLGSRYDGSAQFPHRAWRWRRCPTSTATATAISRSACPTRPAPPRRRRRGRALRQAPGVHINLTDLWEAGYPYYFHVDFPALDNQHVGESVASVPDMTGDGWPDIAIGAPQADSNGRIDSGSVWIISGHLPPIDAGCTASTWSTTPAPGSGSGR